MSPERMGGIGAVLQVELDRAEQAGSSAKKVVLVEGVSDRFALEALANRMKRDLESEGVVIIPTGGATNFGRFFALLGPQGHNVDLAGMCDQGEEAAFRRAIEDAGLGSGLDRESMEALGFFVCVSDLEDELFRALGPDRFLDFIATQGDTKKFRSFQNQPAHRQDTLDRQLWDWLRTKKLPYAWLMVTALPLDAVPRSLRGVLAHVSGNDPL
jgi:hypothetical protein